MSETTVAQPRPVVFCGPSGVVSMTKSSCFLVKPTSHSNFQEMNLFLTFPCFMFVKIKLHIIFTYTQGKGTIIELLTKKFPKDQFGFSVSHTTRKPREGEENGVHYNFTTVEEIKKEIDDGKFIEYAEVHGNYYGTRYVQVNLKM